ncbi:hypothetical protein [Brevibacillus sp. NRS-1366]|uniref:hypothetical protein n=1 Tax=Brevibacillus sp. NRS-1366 TaxID=3233899 RepID=UPI003D211A88
MEKVKLPKEVAESIDYIWGKCDRGSIKHLVLTNWSHLDQAFTKQKGILQDYALENPMEYMKALVEGHEVEQTPEEKLTLTYLDYEQEYYKTRNPAYYNYCQAIKMTLDILKLKVHGINT